MQESIQAALTFVRSRAGVLGLPEDFHDKTDLHIHVPEGATPKDGPSAGIGMCTAMVSVITGIPVKADVAMTGEITLRGQVLPIGGLKENCSQHIAVVLSRSSFHMRTKKISAEIPDNVKTDLNIHCVKWMDEVLQVALDRMPVPRVVDDKGAASPEISVEEESAPSISTH